MGEEASSVPPVLHLRASYDVDGAGCAQDGGSTAREFEPTAQSISNVCGYAGRSRSCFAKELRRSAQAYQNYLTRPLTQIRRQEQTPGRPRAGNARRQPRPGSASGDHVDLEAVVTFHEELESDQLSRHEVEEPAAFCLRITREPTRNFERNFVAPGPSRSCGRSPTKSIWRRSYDPSPVVSGPTGPELHAELAFDYQRRLRQHLRRLSCMQYGGCAISWRANSHVSSPLNSRRSDGMTARGNEVGCQFTATRGRTASEIERHLPSTTQQVKPAFSSSASCSKTGQDALSDGPWQTSSL